MEDKRFIEIAINLLIINDIYLCDNDSVIHFLDISKKEILDFQSKISLVALENIKTLEEKMKNE